MKIEIITLTNHKSGIGFSKQLAVEIATDNIINYLKKYKYEN